MGVPVVILSHKRAGRVTTHHHVFDAKILVPTGQQKAYEDVYKHEAEIVTHPDGVIGLPAKRQWAYKHFGTMMQLDDDSVGMFRTWRPTNDRKSAIVSPRTAYDVIQATATLAEELGAFLFGFGSHANPMTYTNLRPFKLGGYSPGGAIGIRKGSKLWWPTDTTLPIDDYWICLLNAFHHRFAFYDLRFAFGFKNTYTGVGGMHEYREDEEAEVKATAYLRKHFGSVVVLKKRHKHATKREKNASPRSIALPWRHD